VVWPVLEHTSLARPWLYFLGYTSPVSTPGSAGSAASPPHRLPVSLAWLGSCSRAQFVEHLGGLFEHSPWVAEAVEPSRPTTSRASLHAAMVAAVAAASPEAQLALIRAHPDLGTRLALGPESQSEQAGLGLDRLSPTLFAQFQALNTAYRERFGFPFIIAVRYHTRDSILAEFETRLGHDIANEQATALAEIAKIAWLRLIDAVLDADG
jgi:2-oxo-4-hydroxy-4-carboxy-5-ureidoimidazoline decarboxylase